MLPLTAYFDRSPSPRRLLTGILAAGLLAATGQILVQVTFAQTDHPVTLAQANATFDPATQREYYRALDENGTLALFAWVERVDYLWALGVAALLGLLAIRLGRAHPPGSRTRRTAYASAPLLALGGLTDAAENTTSLVMLANPWDFPDSLAPLHATFATIKLAILVPGVTFLILIAAGVLARRLRRRRISANGPARGTVR